MTPSRRTARATVALAAACALAAGGMSVASDTGAGCGTPPNKTYTGSAHCALTFRGFPVTVFGDAATTSGEARVHAWVTFGDLDGTPAVLAQCEDTDGGGSEGGLASCSSGFPDETTPLIDSYALQQTHMVCHVESRGTGTYRCVSGSGQ